MLCRTPSSGLRYPRVGGCGLLARKQFQVTLGTASLRSQYDGVLEGCHWTKGLVKV